MVHASPMQDHRFEQITHPPGQSLGQSVGQAPALPQGHAPAPPIPRVLRPVDADYAADYAPENIKIRQKYMRDWRNTKSARFNAAKRLQRKHAASTLAFAVAGTVGFIVPIFALMFADSISAHTKNVLEFASYVIGAMSLTIALVEQAKDYPTQAKRFDQCGLALNKTLRKLRNTPAPSYAFLDELSQEYERALEECEINHDDNDYRIAELSNDIRDVKRRLADGPNAAQVERQLKTLERKLARTRLAETAGIYWLYTAIWLSPTLVASLIWVSLAP